MNYSKQMIVGAAVVMIITTLSTRLEASAAANESRISLPGCQEKCGNVSIPYPFGVGKGCYYDDSFAISCNQTTGQPFQTPFTGNMEVLSISLNEGGIRGHTTVARVCYNSSGQELPEKSDIWSAVSVPKFTFSSTDNMLVTTGCDSQGWFVLRRSTHRYYHTSCSTQCDSLEEVDNFGTCPGDAGCCQINIPEGIHYINMSAGSVSNYTHTPAEFRPCSYVFLVAKDSFNFSRDNLSRNAQLMAEKLPVVYDWTVGNQTCAAANATKTCLCCTGPASKCLDSTLPGYRCQCSPGYSGNPYLPRPYGCQDIDECSAGNVNDCKEPATCVNTQGSYHCQCPRGFTGDGTIVSPCRSNQTTIKIIVGLSTGLGTIFLLLGGSWLNMVIKKRKVAKQKAKHFKQNGGLILLQQQRSSDESIVERTRIFTVDELEEATNHFSADRILGQGGQGTVYKGMLSGGRIVAIKKSKEVDENRQGEFINELVIMSQINHRNIVKLLGCCLETEVPLLVYEFIPNGTLFYHIHYPNEEFPITWKMRLQIAADSASALAYLHTSSSVPIFHRDIKSSNILLDDKYRAKLSDFGTSRSLAIDQTHVTTRVFGTYGYLDPEYYQSNQFTEKSDVYSFGVVLVELLTGEQAIRSTTQSDKSLISWFLNHMEDSCLLDIVDSKVLQEASQEELLMVANVAKQCLNLDGKQRPTMQQVLAEIEVVRSLDLARSNQQGEPKIEQALGKRTQRTHQDIPTIITLESHRVDSGEVSLLFDTSQSID